MIEGMIAENKAFADRVDGLVGPVSEVLAQAEKHCRDLFCQKIVCFYGERPGRRVIDGQVNDFVVYGSVLVIKL